MLRYDRKKGKLQANTSAIIELANLQPIATQALLGRVSAGTGAVEVLNAGQAKSILNYAANEVGFVPYGTLTATNAQAAIEQLEDKASSASGGSAIILPLSRRWVGKSPLVVASILLPAGTYSAVTALFGGNSTLSVVTLDVTAIDGTVLASVQKTGLPDAVSALPTFTLTSAAQVHFKIYGDFANTVSYIFNIQVA